MTGRTPRPTKYAPQLRSLLIRPEPVLYVLAYWTPRRTRAPVVSAFIYRSETKPATGLCKLAASFSRPSGDTTDQIFALL
jgi:hypothetical protein